MAYEVIRPGFQLPLVPASNILPYVPVRLVGSNALRILPVASCNQRPFGVNGEATAPVKGATNSAVQGFAANVREEGNIVKAVAAASFAAGAEVTVATIGIASAAQGGANVATIPQYDVQAQASGAVVWYHGVALDSVGAGEIFTLYFKPRLSPGINGV